MAQFKLVVAVTGPKCVAPEINMINLPEKLPEGHGLSFKRGIADALLQEERFASDLPNGHSASYRKGQQAGEQLRELIAPLARKPENA